MLYWFPAATSASGRRARQKLDVSGKIHATDDICTDAGGGKCLSSAGGGGVIITYHMVAASYGSGGKYYSQTKSYNCPEGSSAVQTYCTQNKITCDTGTVDYCSCQVSGKTASVTAYAMQLTQCYTPIGASNSCYPTSPCTPDSSGQWCTINCGIYSCIMEFQCGMKQTVGQ